MKTKNDGYTENSEQDEPRQHAAVISRLNYIKQAPRQLSFGTHFGPEIFSCSRARQALNLHHTVVLRGSNSTSLHT